MTTLAEVKAELVTLAEGSLEDITTPQFLRLLNRAISNRYSEVVNICNANYVLETTLTALTLTSELDLPADFYTRADLSLWNLYESANYAPYEVMAGKDTWFWIKGNKLRFDSPLAAGENIYLEYSKKPTRYTALIVDGDAVEFLEEGAMEIILSELQSLYYAAIDENEPNASFTNSLSQANRNAL